VRGQEDERERERERGRLLTILVFWWSNERDYTFIVVGLVDLDVTNACTSSYQMPMTLSHLPKLENVYDRCIAENILMVKA
jgi:hypothetical protein